MEKAVLVFLAIFSVGFTAGLVVIFLQIKKVDQLRRVKLQGNQSWDGQGFALVREVGDETLLVDDAKIEDVAEALSELSEDTDVTLISPHGGQLRAEGARAAFQIYFESPGSPVALVVGRPSHGVRRGKARLYGDQILVTPLEIWSRTDGVEVFATFMAGRDLSTAFVLRDPTVEASEAEIRAAIGA